MRFYATCGLGLEPFFHKELADNGDFTINLSNQEFKGKVLFTMDLDNSDDDKLKKLLNFKSIERIFGFIFAKTDHLENDSQINVTLSYVQQLFIKSQEDLMGTLNNLVKIKQSLTMSSSDDSNSGVCDSQKSSEELEPPPEKKSKLKSTIKFRVCPRITGKYRRELNNRQVSNLISSAIIDQSLKSESNQDFTWELDFKNYDVEISIHISELGIICGIPLTCRPLSLRKYLIHIPLRSTVGFAMSMLCCQQNNHSNSLILDPMCGTGVILIELLKNFSSKVGHLIGIDIDPRQLYKAQDNLKKAFINDHGNRIDLIQGDICQLGFSPKVQCDSLLCDMPFNEKHNLQNDLLVYLKSFDQLVKKDGNIILLMSLQLSLKLENAAIQCQWKLIKKYPLRLGELSSIIIHFIK